MTFSVYSAFKRCLYSQNIYFASMLPSKIVNILVDYYFLITCFDQILEGFIKSWISGSPCCESSVIMSSRVQLWVKVGLRQAQPYLSRNHKRLNDKRGAFTLINYYVIHPRRPLNPFTHLPPVNNPMMATFQKNQFWLGPIQSLHAALISSEYCSELRSFFCHTKSEHK